MEYTYEAVVIAWIDGDTVALEVSKAFDMGFHIMLTGTYRGHFRLLGVDTPERGHLNYKEAREAAKVLAPVGSTVTIKTEKADKYGRYLASVVTSSGVNVANQLISMGLGKFYDGGHKATGEIALMTESGSIQISQQ